MEIQGFPKYLIYPDGRLYSKRKKRFMKPRDNGNGYIGLVLCNEKRKTVYIHRLVALHYIPNPEGKPQVDHINRNKQDNRVENLRWATPSENANNKGLQKHNTSGHQHISYVKERNKWSYQKKYNKKNHVKHFKNKIDCICYKFIHLLKIKALG